MPYYIFSLDGTAVAKCNYMPDSKDLHTRKQIVAFLEDDLPLRSLRYGFGKIEKKPKSIEELVEEKHNEKSYIDGLIDHYTRKQFRILLDQLGLLDNNLKQLWEKRDRLAKEEDDLAKKIGKREEARTH